MSAVTDSLRTLDPPDMVGQSEYRLVFDFVDELIEDGADWPLVEAALENVEEYARHVRMRMRVALAKAGAQ